jgi:hypothetical protein
MSVSMRARETSGRMGENRLFGRHRALASQARSAEGRGPAVMRRPLLRRLAGLTAVLVGVPVLTLGLTGAAPLPPGPGR